MIKKPGHQINLFSPTKLIDELKNTGRKAICVFDIDSTLFCVSPRTQQILRDCSGDADLGLRYCPELELIEKVEVLSTDWGIFPGLKRSRIKATIDFFEEIKLFWQSRFFSNDYLKFDTPYKGAIAFAQALAANGAEIYYLTGRDRPRMGPGTVNQLRFWKLPFEERSLFMKEKSGAHDEIYKFEKLSQLVSHNPEKLIYFFENEPVIINYMIRELPQVASIWFESVHSGRESVLPHVPRLGTTYLD